VRCWLRRKLLGYPLKDFSVETPRDGAGNFGDGMGAVISPGDANLGVEDTENVTQVVIKMLCG
jgi:hypothetical protein